MKTLRLAGCTVHVSALHVATVLPDGETVHGEPHDTADYRATAMRHGYGLDLARLNRCHELAHTLLAHWLGLEASPVFERVAAGELGATELTRREEAAALALETFANALGVDLERIAAKLGGGRNGMDRG